MLATAAGCAIAARVREIARHMEANGARRQARARYRIGLGPRRDRDDDTGGPARAGALDGTRAEPARERRVVELAWVPHRGARALLRAPRTVRERHRDAVPAHAGRAAC